MRTHNSPRPLVLIILDGWGHRQDTHANAITTAHTPHWDTLRAQGTWAVLSASGTCVGLPAGQMGNSEVGHFAMGAGRVVQQDLTRINQAIDDGSFFTNTVLRQTFQQSIEQNSAIHVIGLVSAGGVHSHERHLHALLTLANQYPGCTLYIHAILDGRDTPPRSALHSLHQLEQHCQQLACGRIVSIVGRYYALDRDQRWERTAKAYVLLTEAQGDFSAPTVTAGLDLAYQRGESDEFVKPTTIGTVPCAIKEGDSVIFMNFRADRARQLTHAFIDQPFTGFKRRHNPPCLHFITLTEYENDLPVSVIFPSQQQSNTLGEWLSKHNKRQLRITETEKYAHVTFFFNGGIEQPFPGEERVLIPSPHVATYDLKPAMSAVELTDRLIAEINRKNYDVIICNYANADMVGHTGNFAATVQAIETLDTALGQVIQAIIQAGGEAIITADHGNAELMYDKNTQQPHTAHTCENVPFLYIGRSAHVTSTQGTLMDIAPTLLYLLGLPIPSEMTGQSLITLT